MNLLETSHPFALLVQTHGAHLLQLAQQDLRSWRSRDIQRSRVVLSFLCHFLSFSGKWHLGLNCETSDDHCHHPRVHGFNYFFGTPMTNTRDCQPGHGTVFQIHKHLPYRTLGIILVTASFLHYSGFITIRRRLIVGLLGLLVVVTGLIVGFIMAIPYFNCVLMRDHRIVEQPFTSENLTQRMTHEAVDFIERYMNCHIVYSTVFILMLVMKPFFLVVQELREAFPAVFLLPTSAHSHVRFSSVQRNEPPRHLRGCCPWSGLECR